MDAAKKPHSLDKNEVAQPELYFSTMKTMDDKAGHLEHSNLEQVKACMMEFYCKPMKTNENREKEKDKTEVAQPEVEGFDGFFLPTYLKNPYIIALKPDDELEYRKHLEHSKARYLKQLKAIKFYLERKKRYENQEKEKDKNEIAQPEDLRADSGASCAMMKTNENREKEKDKTEVAQPEVEGFDESFNPNDRKYLENPSIIALNPDDEAGHLERSNLEQVKALMMEFYWEPKMRYENQEKEKDENEVAQSLCTFPHLCHMINWDDGARPWKNWEERYLEQVVTDLMKFYCEPMKTYENQEKEKDKNEVAQPEEYFSTTINRDHEETQWKQFNGALREFWFDPMETNENQEREIDIIEVGLKVAQSIYTRLYLDPIICCDDEARPWKNWKLGLREFDFERMKTIENQQKEKHKNEVAQSFYTCPYLSHIINWDDALEYRKHLEHSNAGHSELWKACFFYEPMETYENQEKEKDNNEIAQPEDLRADSGASCAMMKTNENREREKDKTEVAQPEVEGFDESFNPNDRKYLENPSIIALNPDDELEYWKHWEAYEKKNENREKDKKEVAQPEVEGLDESFDPNDRNYLENPSIIALNPDDEVEYWKHWEVYEKKNEIDDREIEKED